MCLAIPAEITSVLPEQKAIVNVGGVEREISIALLDEVHPGDYVIVHVGFALSKLEEEDAKKTLQLFEEMLSQEE